MARKRKRRTSSTCSWKSMGGGVGRRCFCKVRGKKKMSRSSRCKR